MKTATPLVPPPQAEIALGEGRRIRLGPQLGRGSMATVYRGVHEGPFGVQRAVAVKVFDVLASDECDIAIATIAHAARDLACIHHPNVVGLYEFGMAAPAQPYVVVELVEGRTLGALLESCAKQGRRMPLDVALFIGLEMAEALAGARLARTPDGAQIGVVHGELSASDVLLSWGGEVKVSDFGFATAARASSSVRTIRSLARRVRAFAPEVARGHFGDARSDVFSLGVALREMLVGPRFPPHTPDSEAIALARDGVVHSSVFEPQLSAELAALLKRATDKDPARRFAHAGVLAYELRRVGLAMGVGDARSFLRHAMPKLFAPEAEPLPIDEDTDETPRASGVAMSEEDRFARLRGDSRTSGMMRKAFPRDPDDE